MLSAMHGALELWGHYWFVAVACFASARFCAMYAFFFCFRSSGVIFSCVTLSFLAWVMRLTGLLMTICFPKRLMTALPWFWLTSVTVVGAERARLLVTSGFTTSGTVSGFDELKTVRHVIHENAGHVQQEQLFDSCLSSSKVQHYGQPSTCPWEPPEKHPVSLGRAWSWYTAQPANFWIAMAPWLSMQHYERQDTIAS
jgi:hypothetical protein